MSKPNSPSCERNQQVILDALKIIIKPTDKHLLEIGSGTGQHAIFMAPYFPKLQWHTADLLGNHEGINLWLSDADIENISVPIEYEAGKTNFPEIDVDIIFTANTLHIMSWKNVQLLINQWSENLKQGSQIIIYGPFNYNGQFTSESNVRFDVWLKDRNHFSGIREFEIIVNLMTNVGINLINDIEMPANNRLLHFRKCFGH